MMGEGRGSRQGEKSASNKFLGKEGLGLTGARSPIRVHAELCSFFPAYLALLKAKTLTTTSAYTPPEVQKATEDATVECLRLCRFKSC